MSRRDNNIPVTGPKGWSRDLGGLQTPGIAGRYETGKLGLGATLVLLIAAVVVLVMFLLR